MEDKHKILSIYERVRDVYETPIEHIEECFRYYNNQQWTESARNEAAKHKKPTLQYNIYTPTINNLKGNEQISRNKAILKPTSKDEKNVAMVSIIQARFDALVDEQDLEDKLQNAFVNALLSRNGGVISREFVKTPEGYLDFKYEVLHPMRVYFDPETMTEDYKLEKCRWVMLEGWESLDFIKETFGDIQGDKYEEKNWWDKITDFFLRLKENKYTQDTTEYYDKENDLYKLLELREVVYVPGAVFDLGDGSIAFIERGEFNKYKTMYPMMQKIMEQSRKRIKKTIFVPYFNEVIYERVLDNPSKNFGLFPIWSQESSTQVVDSTSLGEMMIDIQDDINKGKSQYRDYVTQILSGPIIVDKREKQAVEELKRHGNEPNLILPVHSPKDFMQKHPPGTIPPEILTSVDSAMAYADRVSMVNAGMRGESERSGESGRLFIQKVQRAGAAINQYFRNLAQCRKAILQDFVDNFGYVYSEDFRPISIKDESGIGEMILNIKYAGTIINNIDNPSLYVELDEGENSLTEQESNFEKMLALTNIIASVNPQYVDLVTLIRNAPIKGKEQMAAYIEQMMQVSQQQMAEMGQIEAEKKILENAKIQSDIIKDQKSGGNER